MWDVMICATFALFFMPFWWFLVTVNLCWFCRHLEAAVAITERLQNQSGDTEEVLVHLGDAFARSVQILSAVARREPEATGNGV